MRETIHLLINSESRARWPCSKGKDIIENLAGKRELEPRNSLGYHLPAQYDTRGHDRLTSDRISDFGDDRQLRIGL